MCLHHLLLQRWPEELSGSIGKTLARLVIEGLLVRESTLAESLFPEQDTFSAA